MQTFLVTLEQSGPDWKAGEPLEQQAGWDEHADFMDGLVDDGFLVLGGPIGHGPRVVHVVEADSEAEARTTFGRDPWSGSHLVVVSIEPWTIRLDARKP